MKRCQEGNAQGVNIEIDGVPYDLKPERLLLCLKIMAATAG